MPNANHTHDHDAARRDELGTPCVLVVPAYNEAGSISSCLDAAHKATLPQGFFWTYWLVVDDASTDGTAEIVEQWSSRTRSAPLVLQRFRKRAGKQRALNYCHSTLIQRDELDTIVICCDADGEVDSQCFVNLLGTFQNSAAISIVSGVKLPFRYGFGQLASAFQLFALLDLWRSLGTETYRADSSVFAYRVSQLTDFVWQPNRALDDVQLIDFAWERRLRVTSRWDAIIRVRPSSRFRDFYRQLTRRPRADTEHSAVPPSATRLYKLGALARTLARHPVEGCAYIVIRALSEIIRLTDRSHFTDLWQTPITTKVKDRR